MKDICLLLLAATLVGGCGESRIADASVATTHMQAVAIDTVGGAPLIKAPAVSRHASYGSDIALYQSNYWQVLRHHPSGYLSLRFRAAGESEWASVDIARDWRAQAFPMLIAESPGGDLYLAVYDVIDNSPSGRNVDKVHNGIDLYRMKAEPGATPDRVASGLQLGGIDTLLYGEIGDAEQHLCGESSCVTVLANGQVVPWELRELAGYEFIEIVFKDQQAGAILRRRYDDRNQQPAERSAPIYQLATFDKSGVIKLVAAGSGIPWGMHWHEGSVQYQVASSPASYRRLFYFDFNRMRHDGAIDFGANNLEGRVAWSQVYYLHGLLSILLKQTPLLGPDSESDLRARVADEIEMLSASCLTDYPGLRVKRYSVEREPLLFALHLGRVAALLDRSAAAVEAPSRAACMATLDAQLTTLSQTVEQSARYRAGDGVEYPYLKYRNGVPFWADGANVPYNYVSGFVEGKLALDSSATALAGGMLGPLLVNELVGRTPRTWRYWWGVGDAGWGEDDHLSMNTPTFAGNNAALAHITYRTMDAKAVLALARRAPAAVPQPLVAHLRTLTRRGWLLPDMNEYWAADGGVEDIDGLVARRHARIASPWELQSQVWALQKLASTSSDD